MQKVLSLLKELQLEGVRVISDPIAPLPAIQTGDKTIEGSTLFGIWKNNPRSLEDIRNKSWNRDWSLR